MDLGKRGDWYNICVCYGEDKSTPMSYSAHYEAGKSALHLNNIFCAKTTHASRGAGARHGLAMGWVPSMMCFDCGSQRE